MTQNKNKQFSMRQLILRNVDKKGREPRMERKVFLLQFSINFIMTIQKERHRDKKPPKLITIIFCNSTQPITHQDPTLEVVMPRILQSQLRKAVKD
jgi:hypothetical protein